MAGTRCVYYTHAARAILRDFRDALAEVEGADIVMSVLSAPQPAQSLFLSEDGRHTLCILYTCGARNTPRLPGRFGRGGGCGHRDECALRSAAGPESLPIRGWPAHAVYIIHMRRAQYSATSGTLWPRWRVRTS